AAQMTNAMQLVWKAAAPATTIVTSNATPSAALPSTTTPAAQPAQPVTPQPPQVPALRQAEPQQPLPQQQTIAALPATTTPAVAATQPRADAVRELSPNEIASLGRRA